ncbi:MAG: GMC family oxidoreductase, partial [Gemmatimonadota bacterium]|nr:GMC family oxidoreductase [Gemmatimonadota bacterium]
MCAYVLACHGVRVLMLEAGRDYDPVTETPMFQLPRDAPLRGAGTAEKPFGFYDATVDGGWQVPGEPYSSAEGTDFMWWRARMLGGRTNHWGRISLRMGPYDYKPRSRDGLGFDWPMSYEDVEPYYDKTEMLIGVYGSTEGLENTPDSSPGVLQPPPAPRAEELLTQKVCGDDLDIPVVPAHLAIMTQRQDADRLSRALWPNNDLARRVTADSMRSRAACFFATPCGRGCSIKANFQSPTVLLPPALATGNLEIRTDAMVREVTVDSSGRATGVHYVDKRTRLDEHASARVVILAASACESARIMLNSKSSQFPDGLGNGSGLVGKYVMDTVGAGVGGQIPALENMPPHNADGASAMHVYMPWWLYQEQAGGALDFARGYHIEFGGGRKMPG